MTSNTGVATYGSGKWVNGRWTPAEEVSRAEEEARRTTSRRGLVIPIRWEVACYVLLVTTALLLRLWGLGDRAVHHDESLHGFFAWEIYQGRPYLHNPLTHGMFHFDSIAFSFFLFGDNDFTMRLPMALFGTALVAMPLLLRPRMGQIGALVAAVMIVFSPALLYFSRFAREDMFMIVFTLGMVGALFRYMDDRKDRWLYLMAAFLALGFATKETQYMFVAILVLFLAWYRWAEIWEWLMGRRSIKEFSPAAGFLVVLLGLSLPLYASVTGRLQDALGVTLTARVNTPGLAAGEPEEGLGYAIAIGLTVVLMIIGWVFGLMWKPRTWIISWIVFAAFFSAFFTNFYTHPGGIGTGMWQSLGYWIAQQEVERGSQPWYYYFMITSAYEFLPFVLALGTAAYYAIRSSIWTNLLLLGAAIALSGTGYMTIVKHEEYRSMIAMLFTVPGLFLLGAFAMTVRTTVFKRFLLFWAIANFAAFSLAGEKMPWLLTHITLPFIIISAVTIGDIVMSMRWGFVLRRGALYLLAGVPAFFILLWRLVYVDVSGSFTSLLTLFLLLATLGLLIVGMHWLGTRIGHRSAWGSATLVIAMLMFGYTFRASWIATYIHKDVPRELLVYTQTTQDIKRVANEIRLAGQLTGTGNELPITIDTTSGFAWPWQWYMRGHQRLAWRDLGQENAGAEMGVKVAVVHANNNSKVAASYADGYTDARRIKHRAWFPEEYRNLTPGEFWGTVVDRERWRVAVDFFVYRKLPAPIGSEDSYVYFNNDLPLSPLN